MFKNRLIQSTVTAALLVSVLVVQPNTAFADNICIPDIGGLAGIPNISDGVLEGDLGWNGAVQINLDENLGTCTPTGCSAPPGGGPRDAKFYAGKTAADIYLAFKIENPQLEGNTTIVLAFTKTDTDTGATDDWKIHIRPQNTSTTGAQPFEVIYWRDSTVSSGVAAWNSVAGTVAVAGQWLKDNIKYSDSGAGGWQIEMKIPRVNSAGAAGPGAMQGVYFPPSEQFRMYVNVLSTRNLLVTFNQDPWPAGVVILPTSTSNALQSLTPNKTNWGIASLFSRTACEGVSLAWNEIGVKDTSGAIGQNIKALRPVDIPIASYPGSDFQGDGDQDIYDCTGGDSATPTWTGIPNDYLWSTKQGSLNTFIARARSNQTITRPDGTSDKGKVSAKFYVASWGLPGISDWKQIGELYPVAGGVTNHPTSQLTIPSSGTIDLESTWALSYKQSCAYALSNSGHHCIQVDLESSDPKTILLNRSVQRNMDFVTASVFQRAATISTKGMGKPPAGKNAHDYILTVDKARQRYTHDKPFYYPIRDDKTQLNSDLKQRIPDHYYEKGLTEALIWVARGYIKTSDKLVINNKPYTYAKHTGTFGYVVGHAGELSDWNEELKGPGLEKIDGNTYTVKIPPESSVKIETKVESIEKGKVPPPPICGAGQSQLKIGSSEGSELPGAFILVGFVGGLGGFVFRKRRKINN